MSFARSKPRLGTARIRRAGIACASIAVCLAAADPAGAQDWRAALNAEDYARAQSELESLLADDPENTEWRYQLARVLGYSGQHQAALGEYAYLTASHPDNADFLLGQALTLARLGRSGEALAITGRAVELAPDYEDIWRLRLQLAERVGDRQLATTLRATLAERYPDAAWWRGTPAPVEYGRWLTAGFGLDVLSSDVPNWERLFVRIDWQASNAAAYYGELFRATRFGRADYGFTVGGDWQALPLWRLGGGMRKVGDADFEPEHEFAVSAARPLRDGWGTQLAARRRAYPAETVSIYALSADKYVSDYRIAYTVNYARLHGAGSSLAHTVTLGWYPVAARSFAIAASTGEEIETIGLNQLLRTEVQSLTLSGRLVLSQRMTLNWWLGSHRQGDYYRRHYAGLSARIGF